jgi:hypothetical protein
VVPISFVRLSKQFATGIAKRELLKPLQLVVGGNRNHRKAPVPLLGSGVNRLLVFYGGIYLYPLTNVGGGREA